MISNNPLMNFARKAELSVKLPSNGHWYEDGMIEYTPNGEVEVYPMLPKDELMMLNPDALLSGQANINLIKSCVPSIKEPEKLLYPDANVLFLAIQKATYGNELKMIVNCPFCYDRKQNMSDEEILKEESNRTLSIHSFELQYNIDALLQDITFLEKEYIIEIDNGLKIYMSPNTIGDKLKYSNISFKYDSLLKIFRNSDKEYTEMMKDEETSNLITTTYMELNNINNSLIAQSIIKVVLPDDSVVINKEMIEEFINNSSADLVNVLNRKIKELNDYGLTNTLMMKCECCGKEWEEKFYGYNQSDFFGIGS